MADIKQITLPNGSVYNIKDEVARNAISNLNSFNIAVVQSLPTQNIDSHTIYFLGNPPSVVGEAAVGSAYVTEENNIYEEWIYVNNRWEMVGTTEVNLDDYVPTSRKINGKELSDDITIGAGDIDFDTQGSGIIPLDEAIHGLVNGLSSVAWSGSYNDLSDVPTLAQSDWEETDSTDPSYIENKPAVGRGIGNNSVSIPDVIDDNIYTLQVTGDADATEYSYTTEDTIPTSFSSNAYTVYYEQGSSSIYKYVKIKEVDKTNHTIKFTHTLSKAAITNATVIIYQYKNIISGLRSVAIGTSNLITSANAFAVGQGNEVTSYAIAIGYGNKVKNFYGLATGKETEVKAYYATTAGYNTIANGRSQVTFGEFNIANPSSAGGNTKGTYVEIVGNGTADDSRSNARTLDWDGNEILAGKLTVGQGPVNNMDVTTKQYVDNAIGQAGSGLPEVTNEDIGKALKVVQDTGDDIIPQQSITIQTGTSSVVIQNYNITKFVAGTPVRLTLSNEDEEDFNGNFDSIISNNNDVTFYSEQDIEHEDPAATISYENNQLIFDWLWSIEESLELNIHLQTLEPQWQPDNINELPDPEIIPPLDETGWQRSNLGKSPIINDSNIYNLVDQITLQSSDFTYNSDYGLYSVSLATDSENKFKSGNILTIGLLQQNQTNQYDIQYTIVEAAPGYPYNYYFYSNNASIGVTSQGQIDLFVYSEPTSTITIKNINIIEPKWELQSSPIVFNFVEDTSNHRAEFDPLFYDTQTDIITLSKQFRYFMHSNYPVQIHLRTQDINGHTISYILNKLPTILGLTDPNFSTIVTDGNTTTIGMIKFEPGVVLDQGEYISYGTVNYYNYQLLPNTANDGDIMRYNSSSHSWQTASLPIYDGSVLINASGVYF